MQWEEAGLGHGVGSLVLPRLAAVWPGSARALGPEAVLTGGWVSPLGGCPAAGAVGLELDAQGLHSGAWSTRGKYMVFAVEAAA